MKSLLTIFSFCFIQCLYAQEKIWAGVLEVNTYYGALHPDEDTPVIAEPSTNLSGLTGKKL